MSLENQHEFYVTLFSNSSMQINPNNVLSLFTNLLKKPLQLKGNWAVGISEIFINQFNSTQNRKRRRRDTAKQSSEYRSISVQDVANLLSSKKDLHNRNEANEKQLNEKKPISENETKTQKLNQKTYSKTEINAEIHEKKAQLNKEAKSEEQKQKNESKKETRNLEKSTQANANSENFVGANNLLLLSEPLNTIIEAIYNVLENTEKQVKNYAFAYCDIITPRLIGDQYNRCLRVIPITNLQQHIIFENIEYYPVQTNVIPSITMLIADENGEKLNFMASSVPTMCTLHFKKL